MMIMMVVVVTMVVVVVEKNKKGTEKDEDEISICALLILVSPLQLHPSQARSQDFASAGIHKSR